VRIETLDDIAALRESDEVECKLANGRDGKGQIPKDLWQSYSAFANTRGGYIVLGVEELSGGRFALGKGVIDAERLKRDLFNQLNNPQKVSANLLSESDVEIHDIAGQPVLIIRVPAATRRHKPVYLNGNPLTGSYRRLHEGDRLCDAETVKRLLAEQTEDSRDNRILKGFEIEDLSAESIEVYRRLLASAKPGHPFLEQTKLGFLKSIGAWRRDRETGVEGVTVAGLLMFGTSETIRDEFPNYALDYQERDEPKAANRWVDRLTTDGTWSGNLFDFYRLVWRRLTTALKAPFQLKDGQRQDETSVHVALREALVNTLVHADYTGRTSVLIVKRPDMFGFKNPGLMRVPLEHALKGGESDGRNRTLQQMFLLIGAGERAGSGVPKIHQGWRDQHWRPPSLYEKAEPSEQTLLELRMEDLLPAEVIQRLKESFGTAFDGLGPDERVVLVTAALETTVSHSRAMSLCDLHATDMTRMLQTLVQAGFLAKSGQGRGTKYHLPGINLPDPDTAFADAPLNAVLGTNTSLGTSQLGSNVANQPSDLTFQPSELQSQPSEQDPHNEQANHPRLGSGLIVEGLDYPIIDDLLKLKPELVAELREIAAGTGGSGKVPQEVMRNVIAQLCDGRYLTLRVLAQLLDRAHDYLRQAHLNPMAEAGSLDRAFPQAPNDPRQAYASTQHTDR
jgi:ATP-dependent DNA helicase RecG